MGHTKIKAPDFQEEPDATKQTSAQENMGESIPLAAVQGNAELQTINAERQKAQEQLERTEFQAQRIIKSLRDSESRIVANCKSLCERLSAQSDLCVSRLNNHSDATTAKFEDECNKICNDSIAQLKQEASGLVKIMSRSATCVPVPQYVFWGVVVILAIVLGALFAIVYVNYFTLHSKEVWFILGVSTFLICSTIWSMFHYANTNRKDK